MTATKKAKTTKKAAAVSAETNGAVSMETTIHELDVRLLCEHPKNNPERLAKIDSLVESIRDHDQRDPIRVRRIPDTPNYEILSGHRRVAALCQLKRKTARAVIVECGDAQALRELFLGNAERQDLNPIERAQLLEDMIRAGIDAAEAGKMFGLGSAAGIKNARRLLELPESMRALVADGTLPARAARYVIPYAKATAICDRWAREIRKDDYLASEAVEDPKGFFELRLDGHGADARPLAGDYCPDHTSFKHTREFDLDGHQDLDVVTLRVGGKQVKVAQNVKLFDKLNEPHVKAQREKQVAAHRGKPTGRRVDPADDKRTPAQKAADTKQAAAEAKKALDKKLQRWARRFRRSALARQTKPGSPVIASTLAWWLGEPGDGRDHWIRVALETLGHKTTDRSPLVPVLLKAGPDVLDRIWRVLVWNQTPPKPLTVGSGSWTSTEDCPTDPPTKISTDVNWDGRDAAVDAQIDAADVSLVGHWEDIVGPELEVGNLVREFLNLHTSDQLDDLAKRWKLLNRMDNTARIDFRTSTCSKRAKVETILELHTTKKPLPLPEVLKPKRKRKK